MASTKPKLAQLQTPMTSTFPSELSALSARSPLPGYPDFIKQEDGIRTPITPPIAYTNFLKLASPITGDKSSGRTTPTSAPSTSFSDHSDCSCNCETRRSPTSAGGPTPFLYPSSAPSSARLGRLRIPSSPALSAGNSPLSATSTITSSVASSVRSPFSARSTRSPYDWDIKSKGRYFDVKPPRNTSRSVRQVREIVTRTVTYTPRMSPAPRGKRRKLDSSDSSS